MKNRMADHIPVFILRFGMTCAAAMTILYAAARYAGWYITALERQIFASGLIRLMPEYALLCLTIAVVGATLTDVYRNRMM